MGRPKLPNEIKMLRGTNQPCRMSNEVEVERLTEVTAPTGLTGVAKKVYLDKATQLIALQVLTPLDCDQLMLYAIQIEAAMKAYKALRSKGYTYTMVNKLGQKVQLASPWIKILNDAIKLANTIASQYGFTPVSRTRLEGMNGEDKKKNDFDEFR